MFAAGPRARVQVSQQVAIAGMMLAVHSVFENFSLEGAAPGDARAGADRRHQRLPAHRRGLAHDRAPRLARAGPAAPAPGGAARRAAEDCCIDRPLADHRGDAPAAAAGSAATQPMGHARRRLHRRRLRRRRRRAAPDGAVSRPRRLARTATTRACSRALPRGGLARRDPALARLLGRAEPQAARLSLRRHRRGGLDPAALRPAAST